MFTGIVEEVGTLLVREDQSDAARLQIRARKVLADAALGDSIAVNGVCLTVTGVRPDDEGTSVWSTDVMAETLDRSSLGALATGDPVNLERAVTAHTRLGGHMVQGHVDGVGTVERVHRRDDALLVDVRLPDDLESLMVPHGSVTIDGVSLTVNALPAPGILQLSLIEYTWTHTTLGALHVGDGVHVEADMIGKYVRQLVAPYAAAR